MTEDSFWVGERWEGLYCSKNFLSFQDDIEDFEELLWSARHVFSDITSQWYQYAAIPVNIRFYTRSLCSVTADLSYTENLRDSMVWMWVLDSSWAMQSRPGAGKYSHDCNTRDGKTLFHCWDTSFRGSCGSNSFRHVYPACKPRPYCKCLCHWTCFQQKMKPTSCSLKIKGKLYPRMAE